MHSLKRKCIRLIIKFFKLKCFYFREEEITFPIGLECALREGTWLMVLQFECYDYLGLWNVCKKVCTKSPKGKHH